jgi:hypothetical protein
MMGLSKQILQIAIIDGLHLKIEDFFQAQNYELVMRLEHTTSEDLNQYLMVIRKRIEHKKRVSFTSCNKVFKTDVDKNIFVQGENKPYTSKFFSYKLILPKPQDQQTCMTKKIDFLSLKPLKLAHFRTDHENSAAFTPFYDRVYLLSVVDFKFDPDLQQEIANEIIVECFSSNWPHHRISSQRIKLDLYLTRHHKLIHLLTDGNSLLFATQSATHTRVQDDWISIKHVLILKITVESETTFSYRQTVVKTDDWACQVFATGIEPDRSVFLYVFG